MGDRLTEHPGPCHANADGPHSLDENGTCLWCYQPVGLTERALAMLREIQWAEWDADQAVCHKCGNWKHEGHAPDCELAALIRDLSEEVERG